MTTTPHPLVAKAAQQWVDQAARHNVPVTVEPMEPLKGGFGAGGVYVRIETDGWFGESASVAIFPPTRKGCRASQIATYLTYHLVNGKPRFGRRPRITLHAMMNNIQEWGRSRQIAA